MGNGKRRRVGAGASIICPAPSTHHPSPITQHPARAGTVLAFDYGEKRIGVAVGDLETSIAHPLTTIAAAGSRARFDAIAALMAEWRPLLLVVGVPTRPDGAEHEVGRLARRFAQRLRGRFGIEVALIDEHLTSHAAEAALRETGVRGQRLRRALDPVAAQCILESYFAAAKRGQQEMGNRKW
jgi:putative Holliday junction resolvase